MTLPFAALAALVAALLETSVFGLVPIAGATADLVLVCAVVATVVLGVEDGLLVAFIGGLLVDISFADRPLGAATVAMLLTLGIAFVVARIVGPGRRLVAVGLILVLTVVYHLLFSLVMVLTAGAQMTFEPSVIAVAAVINVILAISIAALFGSIERRFGATDRIEW